MRMHRGSSNESGAVPPNSEILPLSAPPMLRVTLQIERGSRTESRVAQVPRDTTVREALRSVRLYGEGSAVLEGGTPLPLDTRLRTDIVLTVIPTFSGG